jgi:hypothetical protein
MEFLKAMLTEMNANKKTMHERMMAKLDAHHERMMAKLDAHHVRTMACLETTEAHLECKEPTLEEMESKAEHREVPKEHAAVETGKAPSKQHRGQNPDAGRSGKPKVLTRGDRGTRRKLAATCRKVSRGAIVA